MSKSFFISELKKNVGVAMGLIEQLKGSKQTETQLAGLIKQIELMLTRVNEMLERNPHDGDPSRLVKVYAQHSR